MNQSRARSYIIYNASHTYRVSNKSIWSLSNSSPLHIRRYTLLPRRTQSSICVFNSIASFRAGTQCAITKLHSSTTAHNNIIRPNGQTFILAKSTKLAFNNSQTQLFISRNAAVHILRGCVFYVESTHEKKLANSTIYRRCLLMCARISNKL